MKRDWEAFHTDIFTNHRLESMTTPLSSAHRTSQPDVPCVMEPSRILIPDVREPNGSIDPAWECAGFHSPASSGFRGYTSLVDSPGSFFIPVPGASRSSAPSSCSSPAASSFDFSSLHASGLQAAFGAHPSSSTFQSLSLGTASTSSSDNSSTSSDRPSRRRKVASQMPDWMDQGMEVVGQGALDSDSGFWGAQDLAGGQESNAILQFAGARMDLPAGGQMQGDLLNIKREACDLPLVPIEQYSWLNGELQVRVFIPLVGVHNLPESSILVNYGTESLELTVRDTPRGVQHRLAFKQLYGEIVPQDCSFYRRSDKLVLKLTKVPGRLDAFNKGRPLEWFALKFD
ncbi:hypothetical protein KFL_000860230 [Klebsormidium nitens]|uniref:CS domain-containing protein n=1 Tax=Klebsormidium nitens TaxID=105231 RepID=A0A1Y1HXG3_KLENI|nr:hypothetical protein KFL_000860230 [Klebsormidium nitens]|eukprot:GAQ81651.1 hypothetical protein KFL_000860230 [Klebsormidium nitens]